MYLHLLVGRAQDDLIAQTDDFVEKRSKVPRPHTLVSNNPTDVAEKKRYWHSKIALTLNRMCDAVAETLGRRLDTTPTSLHAQTISMAPRGSINQGKYDFAPYDIDKHNLNKREWMNMIQTSTLESILETEPEMHTNAQSKTETGVRLRQIIPGPIYHWLIESQVMFYLERSLYKCIPDLSLESSPASTIADHEETRTRTLRGEVTVASDYADFNFLHTIEDMTAFWLDIFKKAADRLVAPGVWSGLNFAGHVSRCSSWLAESLNRMYVREVASDGKFRRVWQGLWSGWRTTSAINNVMNEAYSSSLLAAYEEAMGYNPCVKKRGNGDDGNMKFRTVPDGLFYLRHMSLADLDVQASKQLVSTQVAEYLRIWYQDGVIRGSLPRSVASFVSSDMQAPTIEPGRDYTIGTSSAIDMLIRRGYDPTIADKIREIVCLTYARAGYTAPNGLQTTVYVTDYRKLCAPVSQGGFGIKPRTMDHTYRLASTKQWDIPRTVWELDGVPHNAANAMFSTIWGRFEKNNLSTEPLRRLHADIVSAMVMGVDTQLNRPQLNEVQRHIQNHFDWLNKVDAVPVAHIPLPAPIHYQAIIADVVSYINYSATMVKPLELPIIREEKAKAVARALGLASLAPNLVNELRDATTDERISVTQLLSKEEEVPAPLLTMGGFYPEFIVALCFNTSYDLPVEVSSAVPADYMNVAHYAAGRHLLRNAVDLCSVSKNINQIDFLVEQVNVSVVHWFRTDGAKIYQF
jgi:hypothetical protein